MIMPNKPTAKQDKARWQLLKKAFAIAKNDQGMAPDVFREAVPDWGFPRLSDCTAADLRAIISRMKRWYVASGKPGRASQDQLDYLQGLWESKSRAQTKASLDKYLTNNFGVVTARSMSVDQCSLAIQSLKKWS